MVNRAKLLMSTSSQSGRDAGQARRCGGTCPERSRVDSPLRKKQLRFIEGGESRWHRSGSGSRGRGITASPIMRARQRRAKGMRGPSRNRIDGGACGRTEVAKLKSGYIDPKDATAQLHENRPLVDHIAEWQADLRSARSSRPNTRTTASNRVRRLVAVLTGSPAALLDHRKMPPKDRGDVAIKITAAITSARLSDLTRTKVQDSIAKIRDAGWSLQTCNHYRASVKAFSKWCHSTQRTKEDALHAIKGYNAKEDRRHDPAAPCRSGNCTSSSLRHCAGGR